MLASVLYTLKYVVALIFGIILVACFAGELKKSNYKKLLIEFLVIGSIEGVVLLFFGIKMTFILYPLHTHILLAVFSVFLLKKDLFSSVIYVLWAYMCCQIPAWIASLVVYLQFDTVILQFVVYIIAVGVSSYMIGHFVGNKVSLIIDGSTIAKLFVLIMPIIYYLFDYTTTIWTSFLYSGNYHISNFMAFVTCVAYTGFLCVYSWEHKGKMEYVRKKTITERQLNIVKREMERLHELEQISEMYRKDVQHHFSLVLDYLSNNKDDEAMSYIDENVNAIDRITPRRFCENQMLNLLLSHFAAMAESENIIYSFCVEGNIDIPLTNSELCAMVSNALENAFNGIRESESEEKVIDMVFAARNRMLVFTVDNTCRKDCYTVGTAPKSEHGQEHGYGTRSIDVIAKKYSGSARFTAKDGMFKLMVAIPIS
ncbi:MAG: GHKL domain-containing protein [Lachnospiraceae bacterium]|nr:GHKL domain-containing protein [Lachnospiraceae bacterium]